MSSLFFCWYVGSARIPKRFLIGASLSLEPIGGVGWHTAAKWKVAFGRLVWWLWQSSGDVARAEIDYWVCY